MRGSYSGNTLAFQANAESSILLPRSNFVLLVMSKPTVSVAEMRDSTQYNDLKSFTEYWLDSLRSSVVRGIMRNSICLLFPDNNELSVCCNLSAETNHQSCCILHIVRLFTCRLHYRFC
jgi:hypothetical protein